MSFTYRDRVRADIRRWAALGLIDAEQERRLDADVAGRSGLVRVQVALAVAAALLLGTAAIAFVAANWDGMSPFARLLLLLAADALAVGLACTAALRAREALRAGAAQGGHLGWLAEVLTLLSLAVATGSIALMGQTFHLPADTRAFAVTIAALGTATALLTRSGGAGGVAALALAVAAWPGLDHPVIGARPLPWSAWAVWAALAAGMLWGRIPARPLGLLLVLVPLALQVTAAIGTDGPHADAGALAVLAFGLIATAHAGQRVSRLPARLRTGLGHAETAATGLVLAAVLIGVAGQFGWPAAQAGRALPQLLLLAPCLGLLCLPRLLGHGPLPIGHLILAAAALASLAFGPVAADADAVEAVSVWKVLVPVLGVAVAAQLDERRSLSGGALAAGGVVILALLMLSGDLIGVSLQLLIAGGLAALAIGLSLRLQRRLAADTP
ncbi:DUF2157 domain-containing protein [Methylobacterium isbiliense]|jgi:hypothetical protein|uniref:DUF2157 domain-containing protein n=1 Tax=Methylobacterium isbiliense TaxID=315478 RepID=A0ABQ4S770_9HYPH|nr:DUF2157 domain-containing protein [Methylobacterium isbiliense]MDN3623142.1 DUF2157 domain-containing protein [Methylobacterium isbiliense]GJD98212.1 hypothetical protein GMJLKIPL_0119 [Methylobacterium isbiliense]